MLHTNPSNVPVLIPVYVLLRRGRRRTQTLHRARLVRHHYCSIVAAAAARIKQAIPSVRLRAGTADLLKRWLPYWTINDGSSAPPKCGRVREQFGAEFSPSAAAPLPSRPRAQLAQLHFVWISPGHAYRVASRQAFIKPSHSPHRYTSLTGLLLQSGTPSSFGIDADDESCDHLNVDDGSRAQEEGGGGGGRRGVTFPLFGRSMRYDSPCAILLGLMAIGTLGVILGFVFPSSSSTNEGDETETAQSTAQWDIMSNILGYTYFLSWTLSFYPQILTNWKHPSKARHGVSLDFVVWNIVGFSCYATYTTSFRYSAVVRKEYAERFGGNDDADGDGTGNATEALARILLAGMSDHSTDGSDSYAIETNPFSNWTNWTWADDDDSNDSSGASNTTNDDSSDNGDAVAVPQVKGNDVAFAWHALILTIITFVQITRANKSEADGRNGDAWVEVGAEGNSTDLADGGPHDNSIFPDQLTNQLLDDGQPDSSYRQRQHKSSRPDAAVVPVVLYHERHWTRRISFTTRCLILLLLAMCVVGAVMVACDVNVGYWGGGDQWEWLDYLYFLSFVKVGVTLVKYPPQVLLNYRRKSTSGWQIWNILLDSSGGTLSIVQLVGDSLAEARAQGLPHSWTGIVGNPAKFGLGLVSIVFDIIFMIQHYVLYRNPPPRHPLDDGGPIADSNLQTPLLNEQ